MILLAIATSAACTAELSSDTRTGNHPAHDAAVVGPVDAGRAAAFDGSQPPVGVDGGPRPDGSIPPPPPMAGGAPPPPPPPPPDAGLTPRALPELTGLTVNCSAATLSDLSRAREIYDAYFDAVRPTTDADFGWHVDTALLSVALVDRVAFQALPAGLANADYHAYFDFNPLRFDRTTGSNNWDLFASIGSGDSTQPYRRFNPQDYIPATATHYGRRDTSDVMATQFIFRVACRTAEMREAFARCPDCVDVFTALSGNDIHKIFDLRFVRVNGSNLEVSRNFRVVSVDSSGSIAAHVTDGTHRYLFASVGGQYPRAFWRAELSGRMAQILGTYGGPTPLLMRSSTANTYAAP